MKKFTLTILLSILLASGSSGMAYADKHHNNGWNNKEHRDSRFDKNNKKHDKNHKKNNSHKNKNPWDKKGHHNNPAWRPTPPPPPHPVPAPHHGYAIERDPKFHKMIAKAAYGGTDVKVWRVSYDTYIVKYRKGRKWYTRRFYPYANRYDAPGVININWNPLSAWTLLPSVNINIPIY